MLTVAVLLVFVNGDSRTFTPKIPDGLPNEYHKDRIWIHANTKCFEAESDVREFKDFLLTKYECISFDEERRETIYKQPGVDYEFWSLWFERNGDLKCLSENVTLPNKLLSECINNVYYEPLQHIQQDGPCATQATGSAYWATDILDGEIDGVYRYRNFISASKPVATIVLDTDVDGNHVEFQQLEKENLFTGTPAPTTSQDHGTHVAGSIVGTTVGGAKGSNTGARTNLLWYPVCQLGSSCAWSDIEGGYEAAISRMTSDQNTIYVINFSVGGSRTTSNTIAYDNWGERIEAAGGFWATSAGNSGSDACNFAPAFTSFAISVGAYNSAGAPSTWFTNYGPCVDTWGPGENVYSSFPGGGYGTSSGTSMASPNVASIMINALKEDSSRTLSQIKSYLAANAFSLNNVPPNYGTATRSYYNSGC